MAGKYKHSVSMLFDTSNSWSTISRDSSRNLVADPTKFPNGMKSLADKIHGMGLKFGLYGDSGTKTFSG